MSKTDKLLVVLFSKESPVKTFDNLVIKLNCHPSTLQRSMKRQHILSSYNKNGKFYTAPKFCHFNQYGIWKYNQIFFSKYGNLYETIVTLIDHSPYGYTSKELAAIIMVKVDDALRVLWLKKKIRREKLAAHFIYFSQQESLFVKQRDERQLQIDGPKEPVALPDTENVIAVLVIIIQGNSIDLKSIKKAALKRGIEISLEEVDVILEHFKLKKKSRKRPL